MVARNAATAKPRPSRRARLALRSPPVASTATPPMIGSQVAMLNKCWLSMRLAVEENGDQQEQAEDHGEGVVVHVARLDVARDRRPPADHARRAVHRQAVYEFHVADPPQQSTEAARAGGEDGVVELVKAVFAHQDGVGQPEFPAQLLRQP